MNKKWVTIMSRVLIGLLVFAMVLGILLPLVY